MAYRFVLEVPEAYAGDANVAVSAVSDAQVLVSRNSHGLGFDNPYVDLSVAAHSLAVIPALYDFADEIGASRPDSRFALSMVLHNGQRVGLHEIDAPSLVATIRRDQPWVERSIPKIGEHEPNPSSSGRRRRFGAAGMSSSVATLPAGAEQVAAIQSVIVERSVSQFDWDHEEYVMVDVTNIASAEKFYFDVLGLNLVARIKRDDSGNWRELPLRFDIEEANYHSTEADRVLLEHGVLRLALNRVGHGALINYATVTTHFSLLVDPDVLAQLRATVLMRGYDVLEEQQGDLTFRDPYGVAWSVTDHAANLDR